MLLLLRFNSIQFNAIQSYSPLVLAVAAVAAVVVAVVAAAVDVAVSPSSIKS